MTARPNRAAALALAITAAALPACTRVGDGGAAGGRHPWTQAGHLRIGSADEPDGLNPMFANSDATDQLDAFLFAPVFRYDDRGEFVPELATVVPTYANGGISRDSKTITLHFRPNVVWSDGAPLTARDLRFTFRAVENKRNDTKATNGWDDIAAIDVPDPLTAVVRLKRPDANVLGCFGGGGGSAYPPLPEHLLARYADIDRVPFDSAPISSGPWLLAAWNHGSSLELAPNPRYWRGAPKLRAITWKVVPNPDTLVSQLATHEIDLIASTGEAALERVRAIPGVRVAPHPTASYRRLAINTSRPNLSDARVRLALAEAIDWDRINRTVYHGIDVRAHSDLPPGSWAEPSVPLYPHDVANARRLLAAAGYRAGADGVLARGGAPLRLTISATNKPGNEQSEVQMQQDLRAVGIELGIKNYPGSVLFAQTGPVYTGRYDLEWSIDTGGPDPDNQGDWSSAFVPPHGANTSRLRDPVVDRTSDAGLRTFDRARRKAFYQTEETRLHALVPTVFLYWQTQVAAYDDDLRGYRPAQFITDDWNSWEWTL